MRKNLSPLKSSPLGKIGEDIVCNYLQSNGYRVIDRNVYLLHGELDIVAVKQTILVFIEVKTRTSDYFGEPIESVTPRKLLVLSRTALAYSQSHPRLPKQLRLDVVSLIVDQDYKVVSLRHDENVTG